MYEESEIKLKGSINAMHAYRDYSSLTSSLNSFTFLLFFLLGTHTCDVDHFQCGDKRCIYTRKLCDGQEDCYDGSDEKDCPPLKCADGKWTCKKRRQCIPERYHCDGAPDCEDETDELDCRKLNLSSSRN